MKIKNRILINYILMFLITSVIALAALTVFSVVSGRMEGRLVKSRYTAAGLMEDKAEDIAYEGVVENNGGIQVVDSNYKIILSRGLNNFTKQKLTAAEFTKFLTETQNVHRKYSYSVAYNETEDFWLIVTFPTSIRIDLSVTHNDYYSSSDIGLVAVVFVTGVTLYILILMISTGIYARITAASFTIPLAKLGESAKRLKGGDYTARVELHPCNEFGELGQVFNAMAQQIQEEMERRIKSEHIRKQLTLDIAHDLKNPLAVIMGYAEFCLKHPEQDGENYLKLIYQNSRRANELITGLFELSKIESPDYRLNLQKTDLPEYLRLRGAEYIDTLEAAGFGYEFCIPEEEIAVRLDEQEMNRAIDNLIQNAIRYNEAGTKVMIELRDGESDCEIILSDNGKGIPAQLTKDIFLPFVRADESRNSRTGGSGLGLAITAQIIRLHGGEISLVSDTGEGSVFRIRLPKE